MNILFRAMRRKPSPNPTLFIQPTYPTFTKAASCEDGYHEVISTASIRGNVFVHYCILTIWVHFVYVNHLVASMKHF